MIKDVSLEWMSLNYRKQKVFIPNESKRRMILRIFNDENFSYFPSIKEI